jgi:hypothetical protein
MANVFLSYAREDGAKAALIARALTEQEWTVWWDRTIPPGKTFDDVIEDALDDAACVVVLWSKASIVSHWVRSEAAEGMRRGILVPAFLENVKIPLEFRRIQSANLTSWNGTVDDPKFEQFLQSVAMLMQTTTVGPVRAKAPQMPEPSFDSFDHTPSLPLLPQTGVAQRSHGVRWTIGLAIIAAAISGLLAWQMASSQRSNIADAERRPIADTPAAPATQTSPPAVADDSLRDVPSLVGTSLVEARAQLEGIGLAVGAVKELNAAGTAGTITAQRPVAGERVNRGTAIDVVVVAAAVVRPESVRPPPKSTSETRIVPDLEVPALIGLSIEVARDRLVRRGLSVGRVSAKPATRSEANLVLAQDPAAGTQQPRGTAVSLVIGGEP